MTKILMAAFENLEHADRAVGELHSHGFQASDFSIIADETNAREFSDAAEDTAEATAAGAASGAGTGAVIGSVAGLFASIGIIPAIAGLTIGGPIVAALGLTGAAATVASGAITGTAAGALAGGLIGALTGLGMSESDAQEYKKIIDDGGYAIGVVVNDSNEEEAEHIFESNNAHHVKTIDID